MVRPDIGTSGLSIFFGFCATLFSIVIACAPALVLYLGFVLAPYTIMLEDRGPVEPLSRAWRLMYVLTPRGMVRNNAARATVCFTVQLAVRMAMIPLMFLPLIISMLHNGFAAPTEDLFEAFFLGMGLGPLVQILTNIMSSAVGAALYPFATGIFVLFYYDIRVRSEGMDLELRRRQLEQSINATIAVA